jgi:hypothetical protein
MSYEIHVKPRAERQAIITKALEASERKERLDDYRGEPIDLKVVSLEIGLPVYRMANCRTFSEQQNSIAKKGLDPTFFLKGQESTEAQSEQHEILRRITKGAKASIANIDEVLTLEGQRESILITSTGVVVNGNRRLSAMRELYASDPTTYSKFSYIKCAVLPSDASADDIDDVEAALQARPQTKLDYDWIGEAQLVRRQRQKGRSVEQVAAQLRRKAPEIKNLLQALEEAELYLNTWAKKPGQYALVAEDGEQLFKDIPKQISSQDTQMQNASRAIAWTVFENADRFGGRIYNYNAAFGKLAPQVVQSVTEELGIELSKAEDADSGQFDFALDEDDQVLDYSPFVEALRNKDTRDDALDALVDACVTAIEREKGKKRKDAALKSLGQVHSKLAAIDISTAGRITFQPMLKQIESIGDILVRLEKEIRDALGAKKSQGDDFGDRQ